MRYDHPAVPRDTAALVKQRFDRASLAHEVAARIVETTVVGYISLEGAQRRHGYIPYVG